MSSRKSWGRTVVRILIVSVALVALVVFSAVLAKLTLTPSPASAEIAGANLRPGRSLRQYVEDYTFLAACKQIGGNLVLGAPFGLLLPVLVPRRMRMLRVVMLTAVVMVLVELAQGAIVQGRAFDVDDVILNTGGALIAYLLLGRRIGRRFHALEAVPEKPGKPERPERPGKSRKPERPKRLEKAAKAEKAEKAAKTGEPKKLTRPKMPWTRSVKPVRPAKPVKPAKGRAAG
ncbi:VanZ family protein [Streptomyces sp. NPDC056672]|uniref:VanZ family protein n=1 Tax=Streptomyces sp. NPDC056672 TaxID=3345906 RepID=UPI00368046A0